MAITNCLAGARQHKVLGVIVVDGWDHRLHELEEYYKVHVYSEFATSFHDCVDYFSHHLGVSVKKNFRWNLAIGKKWTPDLDDSSTSALFHLNIRTCRDAPKPSEVQACGDESPSSPFSWHGLGSRLRTFLRPSVVCDSENVGKVLNHNCQFWNTLRTTFTSS